MSVRAERHGSAHVARLAGEIDMGNARLLEAEVLREIGDAETLVVDLSDVTYFDSSGMRMLDALGGACDSAGMRLLVVAPEPGPARFVLRVVAWPEHLVADSVEAALAAAGR